MAPDEVPAEVEIKLEAVAAEDLDQIAALRVLGPYRLRRRRTAHLHSVYLDTRDFALARTGVALRVRRGEHGWEATAKWSGRVAGALHTRPELTVALPAEPSFPFVLPEGPLRTQLTAVVLGRRLAPIFITEIRRELRDVFPTRGAAGTALAEIALDTVELHTADGAAAAPPYYEVEVEQRAGNTADLTALDDTLRRRFGLAPSRASKFERGLAALYGDVVPAQMATQIAAADSVGLAARKIVAAQLARLRAADPGTRLGHHAEALHEQRVAVRRLRAVIRTAKAGFPPRLRALLQDELRWLGQELGAVRDLDVQLANLRWHAEHNARQDRRRLVGFRRYLERERAKRRAALVGMLDSRRYFRLLGALERFAASPPPRQPRGEAAESIAQVGRQATKRAVRRLLTRGEAIGQVPSAADLHALRIRAKRLRYLLEALRPIAGTPSRKLTKKLVRLQDVLGQFNDAVVAADYVRAYRDGPAAAAGDATRHALTMLSDVELRRAGAAQSDFARAWRRFAGKATLRQRRALLQKLKSAIPDPGNVDAGGRNGGVQGVARQ